MGVVKFLVVSMLTIGGGIVAKPYVEDGLDKVMHTSADLASCIERQTDAVVADDYDGAEAEGNACLAKTNRDWALENRTAPPGNTTGKQ